jgi:hypothetical protein
MADNVKLEVVGLDKLELKFGNVSDKLRGLLKVAIGDGILYVQADARKNLNKHQSFGRVYKKGGNRRKTTIHIASREGFSPNSDLGNLARSIMVHQSLNGLTGTVEVLADYGAILENKKNRPFMKPALKRQEKNINKLFKMAVAKSLQ